MADDATKNMGSAFDLLGKSYELVKRNWKMFALVNILSIISALFALAGPAEQDQSKYANGNYFGGLSGVELSTVLGAGLVIGVIFVLVAFFFFAMSTYLELKASQQKTPGAGELFNAGKKYWLRLLGLSIVAGVIIIVGLILLIIPGIIAIGRLVMSPYVMVDKDLGIMDSIKQSNELAKGRAGAVWGALGVTILVAILAGILGAIPYVGSLIGVAVSIAFSLVIALRYLQIRQQSAEPAA